MFLFALLLSAVLFQHRAELIAIIGMIQIEQNSSPLGFFFFFFTEKLKV